MPPAELGRYRIVGVIGRGGMGVVYDAHDPQIDRAVAIKTIALDALSDHERAMFEGRFRSEMRSAGRLQHHNIAALYDTGRDGGTAYIVMERVDGDDLKRRLANGQRFTVPQAVDITLQLLAALEFAHRHQVIHRDVKPANVMLQADGTVKLCDFGVARLADSDATRTQGMIVGSLRYASPEQISGLPIDARTDIFATGVTLFELLTGQLPFQGQSDVEVLHRIAHEPAPSLRSIDPSIPLEIDAAVRRALAKDPIDRFGSAAEFARALGGSSVASMETLPAAAVTRPASLSPTTPGTQPTTAALAPEASRSRRGAMAAAVGIGALVLGAGAWWGMRGPPPSAPATPVAGVAPAVSAATRSPLPTTAPPPAAASASVPSSAPAVVAAPKPAPAIRPADGTWSGKLACNASLTPGMTGSRAQPFESDVALEVAGTRITWTRGRGGDYIEVLAGSFDPQGRFSADGKGAYKDGSGDWLAKARGEYQPKANRISARVQLLRPRDGLVTRECTLAAEPGALPAAAAPPPPKSPALQASAQGTWGGLMSCGAVINPSKNATRIGPFDAKFKLEISGDNVSWTRDTPSALETGRGKLEANGRFKVEGEGASKDAERSPWRLRAQGEVLAKEARIEGRAQIVRTRDGSVSRECTLRAERP